MSFRFFIIYFTFYFVDCFTKQQKQQQQWQTNAKRPFEKGGPSGWSWGGAWSWWRGQWDVLVRQMEKESLEATKNSGSACLVFFFVFCGIHSVGFRHGLGFVFFLASYFLCCLVFSFAPWRIRSFVLPFSVGPPPISNDSRPATLEAMSYTLLLVGGLNTWNNYKVAEKCKPKEKTI